MAQFAVDRLPERSKWLGKGLVPAAPRHERADSLELSQPCATSPQKHEGEKFLRGQVRSYRSFSSHTQSHRCEDREDV